MNELLDKISKYQIINYIIPGALFIILLPYLTSWQNVKIDNWLLELCFCYSIGLIISRVGSFVFYRYAKKCLVAYPKYLVAAKQDPKIDGLIEIANLYRSFSVIFGIYFISQIYSVISCYELKRLCLLILMLGLIILFICSYRRQLLFVKVRTLSVLRGIK